MEHEEFLPNDEDFLVGMYRIREEGMLIRSKYEKVTEYQLHQLAATLSTDLLNLVFGWNGNPAIQGEEIKPFRLRSHV